MPITFELQVGNITSTLAFERSSSRFNNMFHSKYTFTVTNPNGQASCYVSTEVGDLLMTKLRLDRGEDVLVWLDQLKHAEHCATLIRGNKEKEEKEERKVVFYSFQT